MTTIRDDRIAPPVPAIISSQAAHSWEAYYAPQLTWYRHLRNVLHHLPMFRAIRRLRPRVVLLQHWRQRHPDHAAASRLVYQAAFVAGLRNYRPDLGSAFRPQNLVYALPVTEAPEVPPSFVVDVTAVWEVKLQAVRAFASQFTPAPGESVALPFDRFQEALELAARLQGQRIGVRFGEGFVTREPLAVDDLLSLAGRSL